jgi:glucose-1-phosphate cytidylyltransferase
MKVVLFCGGLGLRMGETTSRVPKPMIPIGDRPILWHIMRYYSSFGYRDFILCLGYRAEVVKEYFLNYKEALTNDFVLTEGGRQIDLLSTDIQDWSITFVNTGLRTSIGQRLKAVEKYIGEDEIFLTNYGDTLTDAPIPRMVEALVAEDKTALFIAARPTYNFHVATLDANNSVLEIHDVTKTDMWLNGGYFVFRREIFDYIEEDEDLVEEPFRRLIAEKKLMAYPYDGFWAAMDTLKEKQHLDGLLESGRAPWARWESNGGRVGAEPVPAD